MKKFTDYKMGQFPSQQLSYDGTKMYELEDNYIFNLHISKSSYDELIEQVSSKYLREEGTKKKALFEKNNLIVAMGDVPDGKLYTIQFYFKKGFDWDGASGPAIDTPELLLPSLVHDAFYMFIRQCVISGREKLWRKFADEVYKGLCKRCGVPLLRRWIQFIALRLFGKKAALPRSKRQLYTIKLPESIPSYAGPYPPIIPTSFDSPEKDTNKSKPSPTPRT